MSIWPVRGSIAARCVATCISRTASWTSSAVTCERRAIYVNRSEQGKSVVRITTKVGGEEGTSCFLFSRGFSTHQAAEPHACVCLAEADERLQLARGGCDHLLAAHLQTNKNGCKCGEPRQRYE